MITRDSFNLPLIDATDVTMVSSGPIRDAMQMLEKSTAKIVLVTDATGKLVGSITDGDVRRGLLNGNTLDSAVLGIMHMQPHMLPVSTPRQQILDTMQTYSIRQMPLIDAQGRIAGIALFDALSRIGSERKSNAVVIMAGGRGKRLMPLTEAKPKPMIEIAGKPILEWILQRFILQGFHEFHISVNYLGEQIEDYFGDGQRFNCSISYIREKEFLGTAGALSLIEKPFTEPFIVINGDILASVNFANVLDYHTANDSMATVCARTHRVEVPYGVIRVLDGKLQAIVEKPVYEDLISAGIYVLDPEVLKSLPKNAVTDMPSILEKLALEQKTVAVFPMREDWVDVGRHDDLERAQHKLKEQAHG